MRGNLERARRLRLIRALALGQGAYYVATGVWPLVSMKSFERVTGPKTDGWLVVAVGGLVGVVGGTVVSAAVGRRLSPEIRLLAAGSAATLAAIDIVYAARGRISRIYLLDAVLEIGLVLAWMRGGRQSSSMSATRHIS
jgi:hypothetical protein